MSNTWLQAKITSKHMETDTIAVLELQAIDGAELPPFSAGAHIQLDLGNGIFREYSLANNPAERDRYQIAVLREPASRGGSERVHETLHVGDVVRITPPKNHFPLDHSARHSLLFAAGIGITPILAMARYLYKQKQSFQLHYLTRGREHCAFYREISESRFANRAHFHFDSSTAPGFNLHPILSEATQDAHIYVCGPAGFIDWVLNTAATAGICKEQLHREFFSAPSNTPSASTDTFQIVLARSGRRFNVPANATIAQVLQANHVPVELSCEQGICGACITALIEGEAEHCDLVLSDQEKGDNTQIAICCSRARTPVLVLDL